MDAYRTTVELISALAWPLLVLVIALLYRSPITHAIGRIREVAAAGTTLKLDADTRRVAQITEEILMTERGLTQDETETQQLEHDRVLEEWLAGKPEREIQGQFSMAHQHLAKDPLMALSDALGALHSRVVLSAGSPDGLVDLIGADAAKQFDDLRAIHKEAWGAGSVSPNAAVDFVTAAENLNTLVLAKSV